MSLPDILPSIIGILVGIVIGYLLARLVLHNRTSRAANEASAAVAAAEARAEALAGESAREADHRIHIEAELRQIMEARSALDRELAVARERVVRAEERIEEQKAFVESARRDIEHTFKALASDALRGNTDQFLKLAEERWSSVRQNASSDLDARKREIQTLLDPLRETLVKLELRTGEIERARTGAYAKLDEKIAALSEQAVRLAQQTTSLDTALRGNQAQGRWGELALRNIVELAGMTEHCDFQEQETTSEGGRPDMIVRLPGGAFIAVDAKAPLNAYLEATEAPDDASRDAALLKHVSAIRAHVRQLSGRDYPAAFGGAGGSLDLVVMFLPGDPYLAAAFSHSPELQTEALRAKVLIATPTTLVALLRTVAIYWQQRAMAENAEAIAETARELYERGAKFAEDLGKLGRALSSALTAYNAAVGSFEGRFMPMARRLETMKVTEQSRRRLEKPEKIEDAPRDVQETLRFQ